MYIEGMTNNNTDFKAFKTELRNAPVIHFTADSIGFQPTDDAHPASFRSIRLPNGRWIKVEA